MQPFFLSTLNEYHGIEAKAGRAAESMKLPSWSSGRGGRQVVDEEVAKPPSAAEMT